MKDLVGKILRTVLFLTLLCVGGVTAFLGSGSLGGVLANLYFYGYHDTITYFSTPRFLLSVLAMAALFGTCYLCLEKCYHGKDVRKDIYWAICAILAVIAAWVAIECEYLHWKWLQTVPPEFR